MFIKVWNEKSLELDIKLDIKTMNRSMFYYYFYFLSKYENINNFELYNLK